MTDNTSAEEQIAEILGGLEVSTRPLLYPNRQKYADEVYIEGLLEATTKLKELLTSYTKQRERALLERLEGHTVELPMSSGDNMLLVPLSAIQKEKDRLQSQESEEA